MTNSTSFAFVGFGFRAATMWRLAAELPDVTCVGAVVRTPRDLPVPRLASLTDCLASARPRFLVTAVPPRANPDILVEAVAHGVPVLSETPPAPDLDGLRRLWTTIGSSGLVQVAEQYLLMPGHAARLALVREGVIGTPTSVQVSSTHLYHAVSLIRGLLGTGFEVAEVRAITHTAPLANPLGFDGWTGDGTPQQLATTIATIDFGGTMGLYDFTDNQWWNPLRMRRIVIRGSIGEMADDRVVRLADPATPVESRLIRRQTGVDLNLELLDLKHISFDGRVIYRNPFAGAARSDDDIAVADILERTGAWTRQEGPPPYPLAEACQDHLISLAIIEAAKGGAAVTIGKEAWAG